MNNIKPEFNEVICPNANKVCKKEMVCKHAFPHRKHKSCSGYTLNEYCIECIPVEENK